MRTADPLSSTTPLRANPSALNTATAGPVCEREMFAAIACIASSHNQLACAAASRSSSSCSRRYTSGMAVPVM
ncbi:MAG TPA: hypothetical protein VFP80_13275 [Thermoanaerobaculia bacterium]|nr:hypothetical protein [Thermoanaerobaculia bacterium]